MNQPTLAFDGPTYDPARDYERLRGQSLRVFNCMSDGKWRTLAEISVLTGDPEASISARLRDFRKSKFGSHTVNRRHIEFGEYEYQLLVNDAY